MGVEPSEFGSAYAGERLGLAVERTGVAGANLEEGSFDLVFLGDVIEHLPDPGATLDTLGAALRDGGILAMTLPDAGSRLARMMGRRWWSVIPTHLQYFTRSSLSLLIRRHGFIPLELSTAPKAFSVGYYLRRIGGYSPGLSRAALGAASSVGVADRMWAPDFRDRMLMIARKDRGE